MVAEVTYKGLMPSDWIALTSILVDILAMLISAFVAIWIVRKIQYQLDTEQKLRDYFLSEMLAIRNGYRKILDDIFRHDMRPRDFTQRMSSLNIMSADIMEHMKAKYNIDDTQLVLFQVELNLFVSEEPVFMTAYRNNDILIFSTNFEMRLSQFEGRSNSIFNDIFVSIYKMV